MPLWKLKFLNGPKYCRRRVRPRTTGSTHTIKAKALLYRSGQ